MTTGQRNRSLGAYGAGLAARFLVDAGMVLIDRNWRCDAGELDLVLRDDDVLVFCEVKTRSAASHGHPLEAVGATKAWRLRTLAGCWLEEHDLRPPGLRIDLVGVLLQRRGAPRVEHLRGVG